MKALSVAVLLATALFASLGAGSDRTAAPRFRFPALNAMNLERQPVVLPKDFAGERNLVLIAFQRAQQKDVDSWLNQAQRFQSVDPALRCYELPILARLNALTRWFIENGMRSGIPNPQQRQRTILLYVDKTQFRATLGLPDESRIYALLLDREGNILWRAEGNLNEAKADDLKQALQRLAHTH